MLEALKVLLLDFRGRGDEVARQVASLLNRASAIDALMGFVTQDAPLELVSNAAALLAQLVAR